MDLIPALVQRLQLGNEFDPAEAAPGGTIAFVRGHSATRGDIEDEDGTVYGAPIFWPMDKGSEVLRFWVSAAWTCPTTWGSGSAGRMRTFGWW